MFSKTTIAFILNIVLVSSIKSNLDSFDDSTLFSINWRGVESFPSINLEEEKNGLVAEELVVMTDKKEKYKCFIPHVAEKEKDPNYKYVGPNALDLLSDLFAQSSCSFRLEAYWTYELCHGAFIRQYHEDRDVKKGKTQEFYLGKWDSEKNTKLREAMEREEVNRPNYQAPVKKVDGLNMPYLEVNMTDGTQCDLSSKPRQTKVLYVCYVLGKHEIYSLKETSICEYEVIVLSPLLCSHPKYRPQESKENQIDCIPLDGAGEKPKGLLKLDAESLKLRHPKVNDQLWNGAFLVYSKEKGQDGVPRVRVEIRPLPGAGTIASGTGKENQGSIRYSSSTDEPFDRNALNNFIAGRDCVQGGTGWWKHKFCFGKSVEQYHDDDVSKKRRSYSLGQFIKSDHLRWLEENPHRRPTKTTVWYLYTHGTLCPDTQKPRQTEVKLKCVVNTESPGAISLFLLEPKTCHYLLGFESSLICKLLKIIDEDGLIQNDDSFGVSRADYNAGYRPTDSSTKKKDASNIAQEQQLLENHIPDGDE